MPALINSGISGKIVWLGHLADRDATLRTASAEQVDVNFGGVPGDAHGGVNRPSCSRVVTQYPKGTEIRNVRQLCIVSVEEMAAVAAEIGVADFNPAWCGANMVVEGIPDFTHVPPSSRLQTQSGTTLTIDMENQPCHLPAPIIDEDAPGHGRLFKAAAQDRRGVTAWVEREGMLSVGDTVILHIPGQRAWAREG
ncbi:MAG: MOSC domain-containing protein [Pseudomonadota bacterium]